eukprot:3771774-Pyramimonas_sp.AAC.1
MSLHQYGAAPKRGADMAHHVIRALVAREGLLGWSIFILFIDLSKAFDKTCRELVVGWPGGLGPERADRVQHLLSMGVSAHAADHIYTYLEKHGPILQQWGADDATIAMPASLHDGCWFSVGDLQSVVQYGLGGHQGCKVGTTMFYAACDIPLMLVRQWMEDTGGAVRVHASPDAFFAESPQPRCADVLAAFVASNV